MIRTISSRLRRITTNQLYFPEIDGIRFLAILLVVLFHIHGYFLKKSTTISYDHSPVMTKVIDTALIHGDRGVELFFVLSGFILCLPFAHYYINKGKRMNLKKYYLRRITRLEPPYIIAITGICALDFLMRIYPVHTLIPHWLASLVYAHNAIYHSGSIITVVTWSLEVEIQFYIIAPLLFKVLALSAVLRRLLLVTASILVIVIQSYFPLHFQSLYRFAQYFFCGILLADLYVSDVAPVLMNKNWILLASAVCLPVIIFLPIYKNIQAHHLIAEQFLFPFLVTFFYYAILKNDNLKKIFSYKFVPVIGGMCYSIYLLHYTVISIFGRIFLKVHITSLYLPNLALQILLLLVPVTLISGVFYYYIERPFMSAKWLGMLMKKDKKAEEVNLVS